MSWWVSPESQWTDQDRQQAHDAYYRTFLAAPEGRQVLANMRFIQAQQSDLVSNGESALMDFAIRLMLDRIRRLCGVVDELDAIEAESSIAADATPPAASTLKDDAYDV